MRCCAGIKNTLDSRLTWRRGDIPCFLWLYRSRARCCIVIEAHARARTHTKAHEWACFVIYTTAAMIYLKPRNTQPLAQDIRSGAQRNWQDQSYQLYTHLNSFTCSHLLEWPGTPAHVHTGILPLIAQNLSQHQSPFVQILIVTTITKQARLQLQHIFKIINALFHKHTHKKAVLK